MSLQRLSGQRQPGQPQQTGPSQKASERRGLLLAFGVFGLFWGTWAAALPGVREHAGLGDGELGLALGAVALAAVPVMPLAGRLVDRYGPRSVLPRALFAMGSVAALLGVAAYSPVALIGALVLLGCATGMLDVIINTATAAWERAERSRLMAAAHGCFSLGVLTGAAFTGVARDLGAGPPLVLGVAAAGILTAGAVQPTYRRPPPAEPVPRGQRRLAPVLLGIAAVVGASFLVEDAVQSWSALHLERTLDAPPWVSGLGPGLFAGAMAVGRLGSHVLVPAGREAYVVGVAGSVTGVGLLVLAFAPVAWVGLLGATIIGAGISVLAPTLMSATGARSAAGRQGADLALVTAFGYTGFLVGPPLVGLLSSALTLPTAIALLAVLAAGIAVGGLVLLRPRALASAPVHGAG